MAYSISFNGFSLQNASFRTRIMQHTDIPSKVIQAESRARADGLNIVNVRYTSRVIEVEGRMTAASRDDLVQLIDQLKVNTKDASGVILVDHGNGQRMYYGTVDKLELPEDFYNITSVPYRISFFCADPFGYATTSGNLSFPSQTAMLNDKIITLSGTIDSAPVVTLTIAAASNFQLLTVSNETTGEAIVVSKPGSSFSPSDVIIIDSIRKRVTLNASGIDYTGRFPSLVLPTSRLRVAVQATSVTYTLGVIYPPRFL